MAKQWYEDPRLSQIDSEKLVLLKQLAADGSGKNLSEMLPFFLTAMQSGKKSGLSFNSKETSVILEVLKEGKSPAEIKRIEKIISLMHTLHF